MNIYILNSMNRVNLTPEQLNSNERVAFFARELPTTTYNSNVINYAANASTAAEILCTTNTEFWLGEYFKLTGESRSEYEAELLRDNSFREVE